jgi:hypothetical protein
MLTLDQRRLSTYSVEKLCFQRRRKNCRPSAASLFFGRGGTRNLLLRATKIVLTGPTVIHTGNGRLQSTLARNCSGRDFEFFNRIDPQQTYTIFESGPSTWL